MEIKAEELLHKLQHKQPLPGLQRLLAVYGEEDYYRSQITAAVPEYVFQDVAAEDREITVFEKDTDVREVAAAINSYPFFCGTSLIVLKDERLWSNKAQLESLADVLADVPEYCTVLVSAAKLDKRTKLFKQLKKDGLLCECEAMKPYELSSWLDAEAQKYGARLEREAIATIMEYLAPVDKAPLALLKQELAKLAVYAGSRTSWTKEDVEAVFADLPEASNFKLLDFLGERKLPQALQMLGSMRQRGENILPCCGLLLFQLRRMLQFMELRRQGYDPKSAAAELKLHPFVARRLQEQCRNFTEEGLRQAVIDIARMNVELRQGGRDYARLEEILVCLLG